MKNIFRTNAANLLNLTIRKLPLSLYSFLTFLLLMLFVSAAYAQPTNIPGPTGSVVFGSQVITLPNGNFIVADPSYGEGGISNIGAVFLYDGATLAPISKLTGVTFADSVGNAPIEVLTGGNYFVVRSDLWNSPSGTADVGAVTLCSATVGCNGTVSPANSLIGSTASDLVGYTTNDLISKTTALANGNYIVLGASWDNPPFTNAGFALYADGANGTFGTPNAPANFDRTVIGTIANGITGNQTRYDAVNNQMLVGRGNSNLVTVLRLPAPPITDTTPPVIAPNVSGTLGNNDFYLSDVNISWTISDAESTVSNQSGCETQTVTADTNGATFICMATSGGGTNTQSVTVKRDTTNPNISFVSRTPAANVNGWNNSDVTINWDCTDIVSGAFNPGESETVSTEGQDQSVSGTCTDNAGNTASDTQLGINIDKTAPIVSFVSRTAANVNGWNNTNVIVNWSCGDTLSGVTSVDVSRIVSTEGQNQSSSGTCTDLADNTASNTQNGINIDLTAPILMPLVSPDPVSLNGTATATPNAADALSGIASQSCAAPVTAPVGSKTVACAATDRAGNTANSDAAYQVVNNQVVYNFTGFFQPVDNLPTLNLATAGSSIPVKFSLNGNQGLNILATGYPASSPIACNANEPGSVIEETVNAGGSSLTYNAAADQYIYVWKTIKAWKGTCRILVVRLSDGSDHYAKFSFK